MSDARTAADDLVAAFILCGWEKLGDLNEAMRVADRLAQNDLKKAWRLSGYLMRGEPLPEEIKVWVREVGRSDKV